MITLAHISDVHLAPLPPVKWTELANKRMTGFINWRLRRHNSLSGDGLANLVRHMREQKPDFTAVTGDLVNLGLEAEANTAFNWLQTVGAPELAVPRKILKVTEVPVLGTGKTDYVAIQRIAETARAA